MLYTSYREKLAKRARAFERVWRFRLLFLAGFLLLLAGACALMGVAGGVTAETVPETLVYGQPISVSAETVFGRDYGFEYRALGTEAWSEEEPRTAGEYECRAFGRSVVGTKRYGGTHLFRIEPAPVSVQAATDRLVFGEKPTFTAQLQYDDTLSVTSYTLEEVSSGRLSVKADEEGVAVYNAEGENVTSSYTFNLVSRTVTDVRRNLVVTTADASFEYDGTPHSSREIVLGGNGLAEGHDFAATFPALTEAGRCKNLPEEFRIYDENGEDVTVHYNITFEAGELAVNPRKLVLSTPSDAFPYDGAEHTYSGYTLEEGELAAGDEIVLSELLTATAAGSYKNAPLVAIFADGVEKTRNYEIEMQPGTVEIERRQLTVTTSSPSFVYDGTAHTFEDCTSSDPVPAHRVEFSGYVSAAEVGDYPNTVRTAVFDGEGQDVTVNYRIEENFGTITVLPRPLSLLTRTETFVYDGTAHTFGAETVEITGGTALAEGHTLFLTGTYSFTEAGEHANSPRITVRAAGRDVTRNYTLEAEYGTVTVQKRTVAVETLSYTFEYDGTAHTYPEFNELPAGEGRYEHAAGHVVTARAVARITDCGNIPNELSFTVRDGGGRDVSQNYTITPTLGTLSVTQRAVTLRAGSGTFEYDARPHSVRTWTEESGTLAPGHRAEGTFSEWTDAETYVNSPANCRILDRNGEDVTANYAVHWESGTVTIEKRKVTLLTDSETWTYDARSHSKRSYTAAENTLVNGHTAETDYASRTDAGDEENRTSGETLIYDENRNDVTKNYEITWRFGTLRILQRPLTVTTSGHSWMYDAQSHTEDGYTVENLVGEHAFHGTIASLPEIKGVGSKKNDFIFSEFTVSAGEENVTANYKIETYVNGDLTVTPRPITIVTETEAPRIYDGIARAYEHGRPEYPDAAKLDGHEVTLRFLVPVSADVGEYPNRCEATVTAGGEDVTANYRITYSFGTLTITPRPILVETKGSSFLYDDTWHEYRGYEVLGEPNYYPLVEGHTLDITASTRIRDVGTLENEFTAGVLGEGRSLSRNYTIEYRCGTLEVTPLSVTLLSGSDSFEYDAQPHSVPSAEAVKETKLIEGHRVAADYPARTVVGETVNKPENIRILRADGTEVKEENYTKTWEYGTVTVTKRAVTLRTASGEWTYDAQPHAQQSYIETENTLVRGHTVETVYASRTDAGDEENRASDGDTRVYDEQHNDVTENYTITWEYGTLTINTRPVVVLTNSNEWQYDGKAHTEEGFTSHAPEGREDGGLVSGHSIQPTEIDPTSVKNVTEGTENVLTVTYTIVDGAGADVTKNYDVTFEYGTLVVTPRPISVETGSGVWVYDGAYHFNETCKVGAPATGQTVEGYTPVPDTALRVIDVGEPRPNMLHVTLVILDEEGEDVAANYKIEYKYGTLQITPRPITVRSGDGGITYDGEPHTFEEGWEAVYPEGYPALAGHEVRPRFTAYTRATTFRNEFTTQIFAGTKDVTNNFTITQEYGTATIYRRKITITTGDGEWVYDGNGHSTTAFTYEQAEGDRGLAPSDAIRSVTGTTVTDITDKDDEVGYVPNAGLDAIIRNRDGDIINECYEIEWKEGKLRVKTPIIIRVFTLTKEYDGEPLTYSERDYLVVKKPPDVEKSWIHAILGGSITAPGSVSLETIRSSCSGTVSDGVTDYTARNAFIFEGAEEPLKVTRRTIQIATLSIARTRGDEPLYGTETDAGGEVYWLSRGSLLSGHSIRCEVTGVLMPEEDEAENTLSNIRIYDRTGRDVTEYYRIETLYGTLRWLPDEEEPKQPVSRRLPNE